MEVGEQRSVASHYTINHWAIGEVRHCLVYVFLWQLSEMVYRTTFNSSVVS